MASSSLSGGSPSTAYGSVIASLAGSIVVAEQFVEDVTKHDRQVPRSSGALTGLRDPLEQIVAARVARQLLGEPSGFLQQWFDLPELPAVATAAVQMVQRLVERERRVGQELPS